MNKQKNNEQENNELRNLLLKLKNEFNKSAKDLSEWIGVSGFSRTTISNAKKKGEGKKYLDLVKSANEFLLFCSEQKNELNNVHESPIPKIELYHNQKFYLYFYGEDDITKRRGVSRAILYIDDSSVVRIKNLVREISTDYKGVVDIHPNGQHLIFNLRTINTGEKNLYMNFIICSGKVPPIAIGEYCNIDKRGALVAGSIILVHLKENVTLDSLKPKTFYVNTPEYENLNVHLRRFLSKKELNYMKVTTGIFSYSDLAGFFTRQERKKRHVHKKTINGIFISAPMNSLPNEYSFFRKEILLVIDKLKEVFNCDIYFGGANKANKEDFGYPPISFKKNFDILDTFDKYILFYPSKIPSSVLIEAGWALRAGKNCIFFVKNKKDLPYLFQNIEYHKVIVKEYEDIGDIVNFIKVNKKDIFL